MGKLLFLDRHPKRQRAADNAHVLHEENKKPRGNREVLQKKTGQLASPVPDLVEDLHRLGAEWDAWI